MSIWRLPDARLGKDTNEVPEIAVVHQSLFRAFTLKGSGKYPIAFRSDSRPWTDLQTKGGFTPRNTIIDKYDVVTVKVPDKLTGTETDVTYRRLREVRADLLKKAVGNEDEKQAYVTAELKKMVAVRLGNVDLDVDTAVCATLDYKIAGLFPYDPKKLSVLDTDARVYVVRMRGWMETYNAQVFLAPSLAYSKEVACLGVPLSDILGCVVVKRKLDDKDVTLTISETELRPGAKGTDDETEFNAIVSKLPTTTTVRTPPPKDDGAAMSVDAKWPHLKAALESLTGRDDFGSRMNVISGEKAPELTPYAPKKTDKPVVRDLL